MAVYGEVRVRPLKSAGRLRLERDVRVPRKIKVTGRTEAGHGLEATISYDQGRMVVSDIRFRQLPGGPPVTGEAIREVPVQGLIAAVVPQVIEVALGPDASPLAQGLAILFFREEATVPPEPDRTKLVAAIYRLAWLAGHPPTRAVVRTLGVPRSTASRWIAEARAAGYLGPAEPRKAGA